MANYFDMSTFTAIEALHALLWLGFAYRTDAVSRTLFVSLSASLIVSDLIS